MSFRHTGTTQVVEILPQIRQEPAYSVWSITCLLMSRRRKEPGHQRPWYWPSLTEITRFPHVKVNKSHEVFIHIHQACFAGTGAIVRLPQCQWSKPDGYGRISQCITTTKHSKAKTVCIFLGIYSYFGVRNSVWIFGECGILINMLPYLL